MTTHIVQLVRTVPDAIVTTVHYRFTLGQAESIGSVDIPSPTGVPIPFADLTEAIVQGWLADSLDLEAIEANLTERNEAITNPTSATGLPWEEQANELPS
jgi:hypothetical protein